MIRVSANNECQTNTRITTEHPATAHDPAVISDNLLRCRATRRSTCTRTEPARIRGLSWFHDTDLQQSSELRLRRLLCRRCCRDGWCWRSRGRWRWQSDWSFVSQVDDVVRVAAVGKWMCAYQRSDSRPTVRSTVETCHTTSFDTCVVNHVGFLACLRSPFSMRCMSFIWFVVMCWMLPKKECDSTHLFHHHHHHHHHHHLAVEVEVGHCWPLDWSSHFH